MMKMPDVMYLASIDDHEGGKYYHSRVVESLSSKLERAKAGLVDIAAFDEGKVVTGSFDEPHSARTARETLEAIE